MRQQSSEWSSRLRSTKPILRRRPATLLSFDPFSFRQTHHTATLFLNWEPASEAAVAPPVEALPSFVIAKSPPGIEHRAVFPMLPDRSIYLK